MSDPKPTPEDQRAAAFLEPCNCYGERADKTRARLALEFARVRDEEREACAEAVRQIRVALTLPETGRYLAPGDRGREHVFVVDLSGAIRARGES